MVQEHHPAYINPGVRPYETDHVPGVNAVTFNQTYNRRPGEAPVLSFPSETNPMQPRGQGMDSSSMFPVQASGDQRSDFPSGAFATPPSTDSLQQFPYTDKNMPPQGPNPQAGLPMPPMTPQGPALSNPAQPQPRAPALSAASTGATGNARGSSRMPNQKIGLGEAMMRMGGSTMAASSQGALAGLGAMTDSYGQIQDYNRAREMEAFEIEEARRKAIADRQARAQAAAAKAGKGGAMAAPTAAYSEAALSAEETWNPFTKTTGFFGNLFQAVPGTPAHDTAASINTIEAAIGFDRLQAMRDASPTGGALGQVSEMELRQLNASLGSLRQSSSREQFSENLAAVKKHYMSTVAAIKAQQYEYARMNGLQTPGGASGGPVTFDPATGKFSDER